MNGSPIPKDKAGRSINSSAEQIKKVVSHRTAAIIVAHISGHPVDMDPVLELAAELEIPVVEDCAQSHGSLYKGRMTGTLGTISAFSTMFGKQHCTGGQGGVVCTKNTIWFARVRQMPERGKAEGAGGPQTRLGETMESSTDENSNAKRRAERGAALKGS